MNHKDEIYCNLNAANAGGAAENRENYFSFRYRGLRHGRLILSQSALKPSAPGGKMLLYFSIAAALGSLKSLGLKSRQLLIPAPRYTDRDIARKYRLAHYSKGTGGIPRSSNFLFRFTDLVIQTRKINCH